jgi:hypothetical protein
MSPRKPKYSELTAQVATLKRENARLVGLLHEVGLSEVPLTWTDLNPVAVDAALYGTSYSVTRADGTVERIAPEDVLMDVAKKPV